MNDIALLSMDALREYIEKISTKIVNGQGSRNVVSGTIKSAKTDGYEIQLTNGETESMVHATALYDADYKLNDYVFLISAEVQKGSIYTTNYFIFGLVSAVQQNFANLTEWERFQANETVKYDGTSIGTQIPAKGEEEKSILTLVKGDENEKGIISALNLQGAIAIYANFNTGRLSTAKDYGLKLRFYANDILRSEHKLNVDYFIGQPFNLADQTQKRLIILGEEAAAITKIEIIPYSEYETVSEDFTVSKIQLQVGTVFNTIDNLKVTIKNTNGKNYFFKEDTGNETIEITATAKYNSQSLFGEGIKYYWFIEDKDIVVGSDGYNSIAGEGWYCLNESQPRKYTNNGEIVIDENIKIYSASDNILKLDAQNFKSHLKQYKNKIKCILGYQLSNVESNEIEVYNFSKESYDVSIEKISGNLPLLRQEEIIKLKAKITNNNVQESNLENFAYRWQRKTEGGWKDIVAETKSNIYNENYWIQIPADYNGIKWEKMPVYRPYLNETYDGETALYIWNENTYEQVTDFTYGKPYFYIDHYEMEESDSGIYYKKQFTYTKETLEIGDSGKDPTDEYYNMQGQIEKIRCEIFKKAGENYESFGVTATDEEDGYIIESFVNVEGSIEEKVFYKYLIDERNAVTFIKNQVKEKEDNKVLFSYYKYEPKDGNWLSTPSYDLTGIDDIKNNLEFINNLYIFENYFSTSGNEDKEPYLYYTYYSEFYEVKKSEETNVIIKTLKRIDDWALPQILKQAKKTNDGTIISIKTEEEIAQINSFNLLTNGGKEQGIFYGDAIYNITDDEEPVSGKAYYKKVIKTNDEGKETVTFEIITIENNKFPTNIGYIYELSGNHLYINAEYIQTGALRVGDENGEVFYANLDNPEVRIAGFTVGSNYFESQDGKVIIRSESRGKEKAGIKVDGVFSATLDGVTLPSTTTFTGGLPNQILDAIPPKEISRVTLYIESTDAFNQPSIENAKEEKDFFSTYTGVVDPKNGNFEPTYVWQCVKISFNNNGSLSTQYKPRIRVDNMQVANLAAKYQIKDNVIVTGYWSKDAKGQGLFPKTKTIDLAEGEEKPKNSITNIIALDEDGDGIIDSNRFESGCGEEDVGRWCALYNRTVISGGAITTGSVTADNLSANAIKSSNYQEGVDGTVSKTGSFLNLENGDFYTPNFYISGSTKEAQLAGYKIDYNTLQSVNKKVGMSSTEEKGQIAFWAGGVQNDALFKVYNNGEVHATKGQIAGWNIDGNIMQSDNGKVGFDSLNDAAIWAGGITYNNTDGFVSPFIVYKDGRVHATRGDIANWTITETAFTYSDDNGLTTKAGISPGIEVKGSEPLCFWCGGDKESASFRIYRDGVLYSEDIDNNIFTEIANGKIHLNNSNRNTIDLNPLDIMYLEDNTSISAPSITLSGKLGSGFFENTSKIKLQSNKFSIYEMANSYTDAYRLYTGADFYVKGVFDSNTSYGGQFIIEPVITTTNSSGLVTTYKTEGYLKNNWIVDQLNQASASKTSSDANVKNSIELQPDIYSTLFDKLKPVIYKYIYGQSNRFHTGLIAQEVEQAILDVGLTTKDFAAICYDIDKKGNKINYGVRYEELVSMCIYEIQKNKKKIIELEAKINELNI